MDEEIISKVFSREENETDDDEKMDDKIPVERLDDTTISPDKCNIRDITGSLAEFFDMENFLRDFGGVMKTKIMNQTTGRHTLNSLKLIRKRNYKLVN